MQAAFLYLKRVLFFVSARLAWFAFSKTCLLLLMPPLLLFLRRQYFNPERLEACKLHVLYLQA